MAEEVLTSSLKAHGFWLATAESLTAGALGSRLTDSPGSSESYLGGVIAYQNSAKQELLGVSGPLMAQQGAVDAEVAAQMASGVRLRFAKINQLPIEKVIGVSTTGVAGPGEAEGKAAGTVFIGVCSESGDTVYSHNFTGDRAQIREQTVAAAEQAVREQLQLQSGY